MVRIEELLKRIPDNDICIMPGGRHLKEFRKGKKSNTLAFYIPDDVADIKEWSYMLIAIRTKSQKKAFEEAEKEGKDD
jgi:hypothetical protein